MSARSGRFIQVKAKNGRTSSQSGSMRSCDTGSCAGAVETIIRSAVAVMQSRILRQLCSLIVPLYEVAVDSMS